MATITKLYGATQVGSTSFVSGSFTPANNSLLVVIVTNMNHDIADCGLSNSGGLTFTQRAASQTGTKGDFALVKIIRTAPVTTGASMTVTHSPSGGNQASAIEVYQVTGYNTSSPVGAKMEANGPGSSDGAWNTSLDGSPVASSIILASMGGVHANSGPVTVAPGAGWTEITEIAENGYITSETEHITGTTSTTVPWADTRDTGSSDTWYHGGPGGVAIEIKDAGGGGSSTTVTPSPAALSFAGKQPTTTAFLNVRIREVLVNGSGQLVGNATDIGLRVWYSGICAGAPDISLNGMTTDAAGTTSWSIATGTLAYNQPIFYVAQNSVSYSHYACGRLVPSYE